jgi:hypothetical protein
MRPNLKVKPRVNLINYSITVIYEWAPTEPFPLPDIMFARWEDAFNYATSSDDVCWVDIRRAEP